MPLASNKGSVSDSATTAKLRVFISYSREDLDFADQLVEALELTGFEATIDRHGISGGEAWEQRLDVLIREADTVVFVLSPASATSAICAWEVERAASLNKRIVPVLPRPLLDASAPPKLQALNYIFFYPEPKTPGSGFGSGLRRLVNALHTDLEWVHEHTRLLQRAVEWQAGGRPTSRLLSGSDIAAAQDWVKRRPKDASAPTDLHFEFIEASESWNEQQQSERHKQLLERERLLAQAEAAQQREVSERAAREEAQRHATELARREAEQARRVARRTMAGLVAALTLAFAASGAGYIAFTSWLRSQHAQSELMGGLAAKLSRGGNHEAAALVALEALPDPASRSLLDTIRPVSVLVEASLYDAIRHLPRLRGTLGSSAKRISALAISGDGRRAAVAYDDGSITLATTPTLAQQVKSRGPSGSVARMLFSPTGRYLAVVSRDGGLRLIDALSGEPVTEVPTGGLLHLAEAAFDSKETMLIWLSRLDRISVLDIALAGEARTIAPPVPLSTVVVSPDGAFIVGAAQDFSVHVWDAKTAKPIANLKGHTAPVVKIVFDLQSRNLATASLDGTARIWQTQTWTEASVIRAHLGPVSDAVFSASGDYLATASWDQSVRISTVNDGTSAGVIKGLPSIADKLRFAADGKSIFTFTREGIVHGWHLAEERMVHTFRTAPTTLGDARLVDLGGDWLFYAYGPDRAGVFDLRSSEPLKVENPEGSSSLDIAVGPAGAMVALASGDSLVRVIDASTGVLAKTLEIGDDRVIATEFSPDGRLLAASTSAGKIAVWSMPDGEQIRSMSHGGGPVTRLAFSPNSEFLTAAIRMDRSTLVPTWRLDNDATAPRSIGEINDRAVSLTFTSDGRSIVLTHFSGVDVIDADTGRVRQRLPVPRSNDDLDVVAADRNARFVLMTSFSGAARVFDLKTGKPLSSLLAHRQPVYSAAFSPDGWRVMTASNDALIVWELVSGRVLNRINLRVSPLRSIKQSSSGDTIVALSRNGEIEVLPLYAAWRTLAAQGRGAVVRCLTLGERRSMSLAGRGPAGCTPAASSKPDAQGQTSELEDLSEPEVYDADLAFIRRWVSFASDQMPAATSTSMEPGRLLRLMLRDTERMWSEQLARMGLRYRQPILVLFTHSTHSPCGAVGADVVFGYCGQDGKIYVDPTVAQQFLETSGAAGDSSLAYVLGREVGRHVLAQLTTAFKWEERDADRREAFAECAAGVMMTGLWRFGRLDAGEMSEVFNAALQLGADRLKAAGSAVPPTYSRLGSGARRHHLLQGVNSGAITTCL